MERLVKDLLENVVERLTKIETQQETQLKKQSQIDQVVEHLTKIETQQETQLKKQSQIDHVIERLDTIHNSQTLLQNKLSDVSNQLEQEKVFINNQLSAVSTQLGQEKVFMKDQLKEAQDEILHRLTELQQQNASTRSQAAVGPNPVKETAEFCSKSEGDFTDVRLAKMSEALGQTVKAVTRAELVWLDNQTEQQFLEFRKVVTEQLAKLSSDISKLADQMNAVEKRENQDIDLSPVAHMSNEIKALNTSLTKELQSFQTNLDEKYSSSVSQQKENMMTICTRIVTQVQKTSSELSETLNALKMDGADRVGAVEGKRMDDYSTEGLKEEILKSLEKIFHSVQGQIDSNLKTSMEKVVDHFDRVKEEIMQNVNSECQKVKEDVVMSQKDTIYNSQEKLETTLKQSTKKIVGHFGPVKEEIMKSTNSSCQQLKDMLTSKGKSEPAVKESTKSILASVGKAKAELMQVTKDSCQKLKADLIASQKDTLKNSQGKLETSLQESTKEAMHHLKETTGELVKNTTSACEKVNREMLLSQRETMQIAQEKIEAAVRGSATKVTNHMEKVKGELSMITKSECQTLKKETLNLNQGTLMNTEGMIQSILKTSVDNILTDLDKTKRDLVAHVEVQSQIVRDRIAGPLPEQSKYVCDFYIENFRQLVRSGTKVTSLPWHINQLDSSVRGIADFATNGKMKLWLVYGRHPCELGLQPRSGVWLKYKATITDTSDQLPDVVVGEVTTILWQEEAIKRNKYSGVSLGEIRCDKLLEKGYGQKEGYGYGALLVRYEIEAAFKFAR